MASKRSTVTSKAVPKRSELHNEPIDYPADSKKLESELESILFASSGRTLSASEMFSSDVSKVLKTFCMPKAK